MRENKNKTKARTKPKAVRRTKGEKRNTDIPSTDVSLIAIIGHPTRSTTTKLD
jgi:hypothetical protein